MIATFFLVFIFFVSIRTQSATTDYISNIQPIALENPQANGTCNLTYLTVQSVQNPGSPTWVGNLVILSRIQIGSNPNIGQIGFLIEQTFSGNPSTVDVLIYNSLPSGSYPGLLLAKISGVNGANFPANLFGCTGYNSTFSTGQFLDWILQLPKHSWIHNFKTTKTTWATLFLLAKPNITKCGFQFSIWCLQ